MEHLAFSIALGARGDAPVRPWPRCPLPFHPRGQLPTSFSTHTGSHRFLSHLCCSPALSHVHFPPLPGDSGGASPSVFGSLPSAEFPINELIINP